MTTQSSDSAPSPNKTPPMPEWLKKARHESLERLRVFNQDETTAIQMFNVCHALMAEREDDHATEIIHDLSGKVEILTAEKEKHLKALRACDNYGKTISPTWHPKSCFGQVRDVLGEK